MLRTDGATRAMIADSVFDEGRAFTGGAAALEMRLVFVPKITQSGEDWIGSSFAEPAEATSADLISESLKFDKVLLLTLARTETIKDVQHAASANPTERAFAAGLVLRELKEVSGNVHHARAIIEDNQSA